METDPIQRKVLLRVSVDAQRVPGLEDTGAMLEGTWKSVRRGRRKRNRSMKALVSLVGFCRSRTVSEDGSRSCLTKSVLRQSRAQLKHTNGARG